MNQASSSRPLAVVTGASSGIGRALGRELVRLGYDLVVAADDDLLLEAVEELSQGDALVVAEQVDLSTPAGVEQLHQAVVRTGRPVAAAALNAGVGVSGSFVSTPLEAHLGLVDLNVRSVVHLAHLLLPAMVDRGEGRLLFTASIAGLGPGPYQTTYAASKAFVHLFAEGLRHELQDSGVTVTSLMPGPTESLFFDRAEMRDTRIGKMPKADADRVAQQAVEAMLAGRDHVVSGSVLNRVQALGSHLLPDRVKAYAQAFLSKPPADSGRWP